MSFFTPGLPCDRINPSSTPRNPLYLALPGLLDPVRLLTFLRISVATLGGKLEIRHGHRVVGMREAPAVEETVADFVQGHDQFRLVVENRA